MGYCNAYEGDFSAEAVRFERAERARKAKILKIKRLHATKLLEHRAVEHLRKARKLFGLARTARTNRYEYLVQTFHRKSHIMTISDGDFLVQEKLHTR